MTRLTLLFILGGVLASFLQIPLDMTLAFAAGTIVGAFCAVWMILAS